MNKFVRSSALMACAAFAFFAGTSGAAHAGDMLTMSQMRLADLGYYAGREDGIMGSRTMQAIRTFQAYNGLPVTGALDAQTFNLLMAADFRLHHGELVEQRLAPAPIVYAYPPYVMTAAVTPVAYYEDSNGYHHYLASPGAANYSVPVVYYAGAYGDFGSPGAAGHR